MYHKSKRNRFIKVAKKEIRKYNLTLMFSNQDIEDVLKKRYNTQIAMDILQFAAPGLELGYLLDFYDKIVKILNSKDNKYRYHSKMINTCAFIFWQYCIFYNIDYVPSYIHNKLKSLRTSDSMEAETAIQEWDDIMPLELSPSTQKYVSILKTNNYWFIKFKK